MNMRQLRRELQRLLRKYIMDNHYDTGDLWRSIKFDIKFDKNSVPDIKLTANKYLVYLDKGDFIDNFFHLPRVKAVIGNMVTEDIELKLLT